MEKRVGAEPKLAPQKRIDGTVISRANQSFFFALSAVMDGQGEGRRSRGTTDTETVRIGL